MNSFSETNNKIISKIINNRDAIFFLVCLLFAFGIYSQTLKGDFVFDDRGIVQHADVLTLTNFENTLKLPYWEPESGLYRPVTLFSYALNLSLFGLSAFSFHLINLALYVLTAQVFYLLIKKMFGRISLAALSGLLFLVLPIHTEVIANIIGRAEILALLFSLLAMLEVIKDRPTNFSIAKIFFYSLLAIGSKETAIALVPIAFMAIKTIEPNKTFWQALKIRFWPLFAMGIGLAAYFSARLLTLGKYFFSLETSQVENPLLFAGSWVRIATALKITAMYIGKSLWPAHLCSDYSYNQIPLVQNFTHWQTLVGLILLLALALLVLLFTKYPSPIFFGAGFLLFAFLPVSNLLFPIGTIAGERLMFFPSAGLCLILAQSGLWLYGKMKFRALKIVLISSFTALITFYGLRSSIRNHDWLTERQLFTSAVACAPNSVLSLSNLGAVYYLEGDFVNAEKQLLAARKIYDQYTKAENNLGLVYWKTGRKEQAKEQFLRAATLPYGYSGALENLGLMSLEEGNTQEAFGWFMKFYSNDRQKAEAAVLRHKKK